MSDKENYFSIHEMPGAELSAEKRARISQNFRAAKALLARKRPRFVVSKADQFCHKNADRFQCVDDLTSTTRIPLGEISINPPSATPATELKSIIREHGDCYYSEGKVKSSTNCLVSVQNCNMLDSFRIPTPQPECANLSDSIAQPIFLDNEDFDESILEEIDALCEQKSAVHMEGLGTDDNCHVESNAFKETSNCHGTLDSSNDIDLEIEQSAVLDCTGSESMPEEYRKYLEGLNKRQREAACSNILVPLMIIAGPGSGKTSTMVGRVLVLLNEGICPAEILAMTFTTAAAAEMRDRIGAVAGKAIAKELTISTFHSFSLQLCRLHADKLGRTPEFFLYGHGQQRRAVIEAVRISGIEKCQPHDGNQHGDDAKGVELPVYLKDKAKKWQKFVVQAKASGRTPAECSRLGDEIGATILRNYNEILKSCNAFDYHDLIISSVKLLTDFPEVFEECQKSWKAIVIDEFQDTSAMQYTLLHKLASHNCITVVGDDDQTIFSFSGANISGFDSFREDFQNHKEIRLSKNYRSTRYIVEAASALIQNNVKRCQLKHVLTTNPSGSKVTVNECHNEDAQCSFVVDKILEAASGYSSTKCSYGNIAVLYRRQVSGKMFQTVFRDRKIPFNIHGVAFYRKKVVKAILAMLKTILPDCDDGSYHQVFKALLPFEKDEKKRVIAHINKISAVRKCSFLSAASDIFNAKISGTMRRTQLGCGRKVLSTLDMISKLARREKSISAVVSSVANIIPQKYLLEQRAVIDVDGGKYLNEDNDLRSVIHYLLDDVSIFLSTKFSTVEEKRDLVAGETGCFDVLKSFIDYITLRERENFLSRKHENGDSVTLSTIHQSKGLEWDIVFIVKANESEIPLLHESNGVAVEHGTSIEEERRLLYVAMTRARKKLFILYITVDSNWQLLQPSRFLKEIPDHLQEIQADLSIKDLQKKNQDIQNCCVKQNEELFSHEDGVPNALHASIKVPNVSAELMDTCSGYSFLRRFPSENRVVVSHLFHQWARKQAFQDPKRLIDKIGFAIDERLTAKKYKNKDVLRALKQCLKCEEALQFAEYVLRWERIPSDKRAHIMREKQEHFQKLRMESAMGSAAPSAKQIAYLQKLGCTVVPTSRLHASHLIEQYKSL